MNVDSMPAWYPRWVASHGIAMLPSVTGITWDDPTEMEWQRRTMIRSQHAHENLHMNSSECSWEFDAWRDIFSSIRDDLLLAT
jgi:hypothetical protein